MEIFSRDKIREIIAKPFPSELSQVEFSDSVERGLKGILYAGGRFTFHARFTQNHRKISKVIGDFPDVSVVQARDFVRRLRIKTKCSVTVFFAQNITFGNLAEEFLEHSKCVHKSAETNQSRYRNHLQSTFGSVKLSDIDKPSVREFYEELCRDLSIPTANRVVNLMKSILTYGVEKSYIDESPLARFKLKPEEIKPLGLWTKEEARKFTEYVNRCPVSDVTNLIAFLLYTGCRLGDAQKLIFENVALDSSFVRLPDSMRMVDMKNGESRTTKASDTVLAILKQQAQRYQGQGLVFRAQDGEKRIPSPYRMLKRLCNEIGITPISPHGLRRTAGTLLLEVTDVYQVKDILGHKNIQTTERYARNTDERLQKSLNDYAKRLNQ